MPQNPKPSVSIELIFEPVSKSSSCIKYILLLHPVFIQSFEVDSIIKCFWKRLKWILNIVFTCKAFLSCPNSKIIKISSYYIHKRLQMIPKLWSTTKRTLIFNTYISYVRIFRKIFEAWPILNVHHALNEKSIIFIYH